MLSGPRIEQQPIVNQWRTVISTTSFTFDGEVFGGVTSKEFSRLPDITTLINPFTDYVEINSRLHGELTIGTDRVPFRTDPFGQYRVIVGRLLTPQEMTGYANHNGKSLVRTRGGGILSLGEDDMLISVPKK